MSPSVRWLVVVAVAVSVSCSVALSPATAAEADVEIQGIATVDGVTGTSVRPHGWNEELVYAVPADTAAPVCGTRTGHTPRGWFSIRGPFPAGPVRFVNLKGDGVPALDVSAPIDLPEDTPRVGDLAFRGSAHYSVMYDVGSEEWGEEPWVHGADFYQTFVATGPTVTRLATRLADKTPMYTDLYLNYAVYETGDGPPSTWKCISPVRQRFISAHTDPIIHLFHVAFRSSEVKLVPGRAYAFRLWRDPGSQSEEIALVARRDDGVHGYRGGMLYIGDTPQPGWDAFGYASGGSAGVLVNHTAATAFDTGSDMLGWNEKFGQTFTATGAGLAAVEVVFATGDSAPSVPITFRAYDGPGGAPIGPARTCVGVPLAYQGRAVVLWERGQVPLKPGRAYYLEGTSPGLNVWKSAEDLPGEAWIEGESRSPADVMMTIAEYAGESPAKPSATGEIPQR